MEIAPHIPLTSHASRGGAVGLDERVRLSSTYHAVGAGAEAAAGAGAGATDS
jgi:hypothetical protein